MKVSFLPVWIIPVVLAFNVSAEVPAEESVKPGINEKFLDPKLKVEQWLQRFETESREIFTARDKVLAACEIKKGDIVADIGAGTGLYSRLFAEKTGVDGWVYAVDINPRFLEHIRKMSVDKNLANISPVLCRQDSVSLAPNSVDVLFICDTYHHFEYPKSSLRSLHKSLRPGGKMIVIDFERIPGVTREWVMNHVRAGKEVFSAEISAAGFVLEKEVEIAELKENYFLVFRKAE